MAYDYYEEEGGWKKNFEIVIPVILLIVVLVILGWNMGWLAGIPVLGNLFGTAQVNTLIVGDDGTISDIIQTQLAAEYAINVEIMTPQEISEKLDPTFIEKYNLLIMTEGSNGEGLSMPRKALDNIRHYHSTGKPILFIGRSGYLVTGSTQERGWSVLGFVPVQCVDEVEECDSTTGTFTGGWAQVSGYANTFMYSRSTDHPLSSGLKDKLEFGSSAGNIHYVKVAPTTGTEVWQLETEAGRVPGVVYSTGVTGGKVAYFALHPKDQIPLLRNAIKTLTGV